MNVIKFKSSFSLGDVPLFKEYQGVLTPVRQDLDIIQGEENAYMGILLPTLAMALKQLQALMDSGGISVCHPLLRAMIEGIEARFSAQFVDLDCILASDFYPHFKLVWVECLDDLKYDTKEITRKARSAMVSVLEDQNANLGSISGSSDGDDSAADDFFNSLYRKSKKEKILHQSWFKIFLMKIQNAKLRSVKKASQLSSFSNYSLNSTPQSLRPPLWNDFSHWEKMF